MTIKTAAIIGLGGIGTSVYPGLIKALGKENVYIVAEGNRKNKFVNGINIDNIIYDVNIADSSKIPNGVDLIIFAVKGAALDRAIEDARKYVNDNTIIMSIMNGIESEEIIYEAYGHTDIIYSYSLTNGTYKNGSYIISPVKEGLVLGISDKQSQRAVAKLATLEDLIIKTEISYRISDDIMHDMWFKFLLNVSGNCVAAVLGADTRYFQKLDSANMARRCIQEEIVRLSVKMGTGLTQKDIEELKDYYMVYPPEAKCSTLQDVLAGKETENEMLCGTVVRLGEKNGVDTPATKLLYYMLKAIDDRNKGMLE